MKRTVQIILASMIMAVLMAGCGGSDSVKPTISTTPIQDLKAPEWVLKGGGAFAGERGKVFYGIGSAYGIRNPATLREAADTRARNDVAKIFQLYTASLTKDYVSSIMAGDPNVTSEEQLFERVIKQVTTMTLSGSEIVDHWQNPETGEFFSLARLDLNAFKDNLERMKDLNEKVKKYIRENADRMFNELEKEEAKLKGQ